MYSRIKTAALYGIASIPVLVEVDMSPGLPVFDMVGNISTQVREGKERIRTALHNLGILLPAKRITVNLSPAKIRKDGAAFDLPIALGVLSALGMVEEKRLEEYLVIGELNLSGDLLPVNGVLPIVSDAIARGIHKFIIPLSNCAEANLIEGASVYGFSKLEEVFVFLQGGNYEPIAAMQSMAQEKHYPDFRDVNGQLFLRRAAEIAAAGMHNLLLIGPPGAGKTMIAERMPSILPPLTAKEQLEISKIYSIKGLLAESGGLLRERPFRNPHHTVTKAGLTGGGMNLMPGEISLAHTGVLFLDELTEFDKDTIEVLREPMEENQIHITRQNGTVSYPSDFLLMAAMNPCNCGYYPNMQKCRCTPAMRRRYYGRLSQPLIDRIDLFVRAEPLSFDDLTQKKQNESSDAIRARVIACHQRQYLRYENEDFLHNSQIPASRIREFCALSTNLEKMMEHMFEHYQFTGRTYHKILRVARTIADLDGKEQIAKAHLKEALCYRNPDEFSMEVE